MGEIREPYGPCPRCGHGIPNDHTPGAYVGQLSRTDNSTMICNACATHEALLQSQKKDIGQENWPVEVPSALYDWHRPEST